MTAKNRHRNSEKSATSNQDDAPKKSQTGTSVSGVGGPGPQGIRSRSCIGIFATTVFYIALIGSAGFAAFYLQKVVEQIQESTAKQDESARLNADMGTKLDSVVQQVGGKLHWGGVLMMSKGIRKLFSEFPVKYKPHEGSAYLLISRDVFVYIV